MISKKIHPVKYQKAIISLRTKLFNRVKIYNTLSGKKEVIKPLKGKQINFFVCGPTVYDFSHIGHARSCIIFDCFVKYLKFMGFKVFYLQNITDVDDKIIAGAREKKVLPKDLAEAFTKEYLKNMKELGIDSVTKYEKTTHYIKEIISQINRLLDKGYAYKLDDGIYYDIGKFKDYGKLSGRTVLQAEDATSRIDYSKSKRNKGDFCLWKLNENKDEPSWPSPFGRGRPGWHIEDTAITEKYFGPQYDIHGGGRDLIFPHHEAEISQMEAISGKKPMVKYWLHTGFLTVDGQKMSKSLNNSTTIDSFLKRYSCQEMRFWIVKNLWRSPINYSDSVMIEVKLGLEKIEEILRKLKSIKKVKPTSAKLKAIANKMKKNFYKNLEDDFNTPKAFAVIYDSIKDINRILDQNLAGKGQVNEIYKFFEDINKIFGFIDFKKLKEPVALEEVKQLVKEREMCRKNSDWQKSDELRREIEKYGYSIKDTKEGPIINKL